MFFVNILLFFFNISCSSITTIALSKKCKILEIEKELFKIDSVNNDEYFRNGTLEYVGKNASHGEKDLFMLSILSFIAIQHSNNTLRFMKFKSKVNHYFLFDEQRMPILLNDLSENKPYLIAISTDREKFYIIKLLKHVDRESRLELNYFDDILLYTKWNSFNYKNFTYENIKEISWYKSFEEPTCTELEKIFDNVINPIVSRTNSIMNYFDLLWDTLNLETELENLNAKYNQNFDCINIFD